MTTLQEARRERGWDCTDVAEEVAAACSRPGEEQIRRRAYEIYLRRGGGPGDPLEDWLQAERELREELVRARQGPAPGAMS